MTIDPRQLGGLTVTERGRLLELILENVGELSQIEARVTEIARKDHARGASPYCRKAALRKAVRRIGHDLAPVIFGRSQRLDGIARMR